MDLRTSYNPAWRAEDEGRLIWIDKLYRLDGRQHKCHPMHATYTGLAAKYGQVPWKVN